MQSNYGGNYSTPHHNTLLPVSRNNGTSNSQSLYPTLDRGRKTVDRTSGMHTLPPMPKSFKFQTLATVTARMFWASSSRKDEELEFLGAVERGDLVEVRAILSKPDPTNDKETNMNSDVDTRDILFIDDSSDEGDQTNDDRRTKSENSIAQGKQSSSESSSKQNTFPILVEPVKTTEKSKKSKSLRFDKNCRDPWGRSALFISISKKNLEMIELLLEKEVEIGECLYHAVEFGYYDVVKLLIKASERRDQVITGEDSFYTPGLTPIQLAAHKNDFIMLKILHTHGFRIMGNSIKLEGRNSYKKEDGSVLHKAWHETNNRLLFYRAMSSPAYLIMMFTEGGFDDHRTGKCDFLERLFSLYDKLRKKAHKDLDSRGVYLEIAEQIETFSCRLLDEVRSADDLATALRFNPPGMKSDCEVSPSNTLLPIARACDVQMKQFVAHQHCQLALSSIRLGNVFESGSGIKTYLIRIFLAFIFPILSLFYIIAPNSRVGKLTKNPMINLSCHMMSEIMFVLVIFIRLVLLSYRECDCLGTPPHVMEIIIMLWVVGKALNVLKSLSRQSIWSNFTNIWKLNDMGTLGLFVVVFVFRSIDIYTTTGNKPTGFYWNCPDNYKDVNSTICDRQKWTNSEKWPIMLAEGCMSFLHLLIFIRAMELMYIDRTFGPLQLSLDKMLRDTIRFLIVFSISFIAFACVMSQLYWSYGKPREKRINSTKWKVCDEDSTILETDCEPVYSQIQNSILEQFWTLFGYGYKTEPPQAVETPIADGQITKVVGMVATGLFHIWAVVVMLNMLIAMLSFSFERVRGNAELEWKFHRTNTWLRFIRTEVHPRPPPMNLIPSKKVIMHIAKCAKRCIAICTSPSGTQREQFQLKPDPAYQSPERLKYNKVLKRVTDRYLKKHLLEEFQHDEDTHFLLQKRIPSRSASPSTDIADNVV